MAGVKAVVSLAFAGVVGLTLLVLGCALPSFNTWWPLFVVIFYVLAPIPILISRHLLEDSSETSACFELAVFITTGIVASVFAFPMVLAHALVIRWLACLCVSLASVLMYLTILAYFYVHREDHSWGSSGLF